MKSILLRVLCFLAITSCVGFVNAQGLELQSVTKAPNSRFKPGGILVLLANVINRSEQVEEGTLVTIVDGDTSKEYAVKIRVPAGSTAATTVYVRVPQSVAGKELAEVRTLLYVKSGDREVVKTRNGVAADYSFSLAPDRTETFAAFFMDPEPPLSPFWVWPASLPSMTYELGIATRIDSGATRRIANFDSKVLPMSQADWAPVDCAFISDKHVLEDAGFVEGLRRFLSNGGKCWIMYDRIPDSLVRPLLGAHQMCETIDEVEFNKFTVDVIGGTTPLAESDREVISTLQPIRMKRVIQSGGKVTHEIDGWPAAIWMKVGFGELLLTTLEPEGWVEKRVSDETTLDKTSQYASRMWANSMALDANAPTLSKPLEQTADYPMKLMGNPVVPKSWVMTALTGFVVLLSLIGAWRAFAGDMSMLGLIAPIVSVLVGAGLVFASSFVRREQTETVAKLQLVQVAEDGKFANVREQSAVYLTSGTEMVLSSTVDGRAQVEGELGGGIERFELNDFQDWTLKNSSWPPGVWRYRTDYTVPTSDLIVEGKLTDSALQLTLPNLPSPLEDPVLNYAVGGPMLVQGSGENLSVDGSQEANGERWIAGTLISNEQQRRIEIYQEFFKAQERVQGTGGVLYGWTQLWNDGPKWSKQLDQKGSALVALPVRLQRPTEGESIFVPHGVIQIRRDLSQIGSTFAFSDVTGKWEKELTMGVTARIQAVLPQEILPFAADSLELKLDMKAPQRDVTLTVETNSGSVEVAQFSSPSIPWQSTITDPQILEAAKDGVLTIVLNVGDRKDLEPGQTSTTVVAWQVDDFQMSARGKVSASK